MNGRLTPKNGMSAYALIFGLSDLDFCVKYTWKLWKYAKYAGMPHPPFNDLVHNLSLPGTGPCWAPINVVSFYFITDFEAWTVG